MKRPGIWITAALIGGFSLGAINASDEPTKVDFIEVPRTKIIHEPAPDPVKVPTIPQSCLDALAYADDITRAAEAIYRSGQEQLQIIEDGRLTLIRGEPMIEIDRRQRDLHGKTVGDLYDLEEAFAMYDTAEQECEKQDD